MQYSQAFEFRWVRDYEIAGMRQLTQEFVFSFDAGEEATAGEAKVKPITTAGRQRGAYYTPIDTAKQLRKRRLRVSQRVKAPLLVQAPVLGRCQGLILSVWCSQRGEDPRVLPAPIDPETGMPEEAFWDGINLKVRKLRMNPPLPPDKSLLPFLSLTLPFGKSSSSRRRRASRPRSSRGGERSRSKCRRLYLDPSKKQRRQKEMEKK
jgi:hypothetical protein